MPESYQRWNCGFVSFLTATRQGLAFPSGTLFGLIDGKEIKQLMFSEFKKFILRGNVVDLAVGIVIGAAFTSVINALVSNVITPLISVIYGGHQFSKAVFHFRGNEFGYGAVVNSLISFLMVAAVIFFFVVQPINKLTELAARNKGTEEPTTKKCEYCLSVIPVEATRCKFCTSKLEAKKA